MGKKDKLLIAFKAAKTEFKWLDLVATLNSLGFTQLEAEGSRVDFVQGDLVIKLHKPHPQKEVKAYALKQLKETLKKEGFL